ncbi:hypothetical protein ACIOZL_41965, partial [Streptomyces sp. NPDC087769]|uniref:hypothetical protein n=1 Tax=Streptomyces sp. NPDC087769 TaxID=3365802 RepID=UPI0037FC0F5F
DLIRTLELGILLAQGGKLLTLGGGEQAVAFAGVGLGLGRIQLRRASWCTPSSSAMRRRWAERWTIWRPGRRRRRAAGW